jgi:autotransporter-associated beta strand protein
MSCLLLGASGMANAAALTWNVAGGGNWDTSAANWSGPPSTFTDGGVDSVTFSNTAGGVIAVAADMTPSSVTVNAASGTYEFTGGPIDGSGTLSKSGAGTLTLSGGNTYSGTTTVSNGVLKLNHATALGGGVLNFGGNLGSSLFPVIGLTANSGTFTRTIVNGAGGVNWNSAAGGFAAYGGDRSVNFGGVGGEVGWSSSLRFGAGLILGAPDADGTVIIQNGININNGFRTIQLQNGSHAVDAILAGALRNSTPTGGNLTVTGAGNLAITGTASSNFNVKVDTNAIVTIGNGSTTGSLVGGTVEHYGTLSFNRSDAMTVANTIGSAPGQGGQVRQIGAGTTTLTATNTYTGATTVSAGTLLVNGSLGDTAVTVGASGTLGGSGTIGTVAVTNTVTVNGTLAPGTSPGILTINDNLDLNGVLAMEINTLTVGTGYDQVALNGTGELGGTLNLVWALPSLAALNTELTLIANDLSDSFTGFFSNAADLALVTDNLGGQWEVRYVSSDNYKSPQRQL